MAFPPFFLIEFLVLEFFLILRKLGGNSKIFIFLLATL